MLKIKEIAPYKMVLVGFILSLEFEWSVFYDDLWGKMTFFNGVGGFEEAT